MPTLPASVPSWQLWQLRNAILFSCDVYLEVSAFFFLLHAGAAFVLIDDSTLTFAGFGKQHFLNNFRQGGRFGFNRAG